MRRFRVILADPPWQLDDQLPGPGRGASKHYQTMPVDHIRALRLPLMEPDSLLFMWRLSSMQREALDVVFAWGFEVKSELIWVKTTGIGMGHYTRLDHEVCLICAKGRGASLIEDHGVRSVVLAPRGKHSEKPDAAYEAIERMVGNVPRVELFARRRRPGWDCLGNELGTEIGFGLLGGANG